jgi:hypothetical protein
MPRQIEQHHAESGFLCVAWKDVLINVWASDIGLTALDASARAGNELAAQSGRKIGVITILEEGVRIPDDEVRERAAEHMRSGLDHMGAEAIVVLGTGFRPSALRTAYATLTLVARSAHPRTTVGTEDEAAAFIVESLGFPASTLADLLAVVQESRKRVLTLVENRPRVASAR